MRKSDYSAFPRHVLDDRSEGMTLRDYLAAHAMMGIISGSLAGGLRVDDVRTAEASFAYADAMLAEREK